MKVKKVVAGVCAAALAASGALALGGCAQSSDVEVSVKDKTVTSKSVSELSESEYVAFLQASGFSEAAAQATVERIAANAGQEGYEDYKVENVGGTRYFTISSNTTAKVSSDVLNDMRYVVYRGSGSMAATVAAAQKDPLKDVASTATATVKFDKKVVDSNLPIVDEYTVGKTLQGSASEIATDSDIQRMCAVDDCAWVVFDKAAYKVKTITPDVKAGLTNNTEVTFNSPGIIQSITLDGKKADGFHRVVWFKEGKHTVKVKLLGGYSKTYTYTFDMTMPKIKATRAKGGVVIKATDKNGIAKVKVNGKKVKNGCKLTKRGTYSVSAYDKAGNLATKTVTV